MKKIKWVLSTLTGAILITVAAACGAVPTPETITVVETVVVEKEVAGETVTVVETVVVEKEVEVVVTATPAPEVETAAAGDHLIWGAWGSPDSLDPHKFAGSQGGQALANLLDPLIWRNPEDNKYYPGLAKNWEYSDDYMVLTLELRDDVTFHDGTPFDAEAVKYTFDRIMDPETQAALAASYMGNFESSEVVGPYSIKITFKAPSPLFIEDLTHPALSPISPTAAEMYGDDFSDHVVGAGPFRLVTWDHEKDEIIMERFEDYHWAPSFFDNEGPAYLESLVWKGISDTAARGIALEAGEVDIASGMAMDDVVRLMDDPAYALWKWPSAGITHGMEFNLKRPPLDDLRVRQALVTAVDVVTLNEGLYFGLYNVPTGPFRSGLLCWDAEVTSIWPYDLDNAATLLDEAGWVMGSDGIREKDGQKLSLTSLYPAGDDDSPLVFIQSEWQKLGVELMINKIDYNAYWDEAPKGDIDVYWGPKSGADPDVARLKYGTDASLNFSGISDPQLDEYLAAGIETDDLNERCEAYSQVQQFIMENFIMIPYSDFNNLMVSTSKVDGLKYRGDGAITYTQDAKLLP